MNEPHQPGPQPLMPWGPPSEAQRESHPTSWMSWRDWRAATWAMLLWGILFPVLWAVVIATAREDGHHLTLLTAFLFVVVGAGIWATGLVIGAIVWGVSVLLRR